MQHYGTTRKLGCNALLHQAAHFGLIHVAGIRPKD